MIVILDRNSNNLSRIENEAKQNFHAVYINDSDYVMTCTTSINSISNTLKKLWIQPDLHSSYIETIYNDKE